MIGKKPSPKPSRGRSMMPSQKIPCWRDKISRLGVLSVALIIYSGITLGLIAWNQERKSVEQDISRLGSNMVRKSVGANRAMADLAKDLSAPAEGTQHDTSPGRKEKSGDKPGAGADGLHLAGHYPDAEEKLLPPDRRNDPTHISAPYANEHETGRGEPEPFVLPGLPGGSQDGNGEDSGNHIRGSGRDSKTTAQSMLPYKPAFEDMNGRESVDGRSKVNALMPTSPPMDQPFDVTLVSQTSQNRFWMLPFLCKRWSGPISIAILREDAHALPEGLCDNMLITATPAGSPEELNPISYPVNRLRNVAVRAVDTSHFLMTDIDIWPDVNAYQALHVRYRVETERLEDARSAIVFTAFSRRRFCEEETCLQYADDVPETINTLKPCLESNTCGRFDAANQSGQGTAYVYYWRSMLRQPNQRMLEHIICFKSHRFEPYLVVRKSSILPMFDERFNGYGKNKIQWINHLRYSGFSFYVMPVNFVIHAPHPKSEAKTSWEKTGGGKQGKGNKLMDIAFEKFMQELSEEKGEEEMKTTLCQARDRKDHKPRKTSQFTHMGNGDKGTAGASKSR